MLLFLEIKTLQEELGNKFHDVKDHVILTVRNNSMLVAYLLMGMTSLILVIGTLIVWYRHRHSNRVNTEHSEKRESKVTTKERVTRSNSENNNSIQNGNAKVSSGSESPVKSRIPVRASKVKQS